MIENISICNVAYHFKVNGILNNSLNVFIHFSEEIVSKLLQSNFWTDTIFKIKKMSIKSIQKILSVFQYPHLIEATMLIDFVPV
jgi:hypothetical protein